MKLFALVFALQCAYGFVFNLQPRIVNGIPSNPEDFPFYVYLDVKDSFGNKCGGSLISDRWIITAAHCIRPISRRQWSVIQAHVPGDGSGEIYFIKPENQFLYPNMDHSTMYHDIGLLKLPTPMEPHPFAAPVKLAAVCNENVANEKIIAIGKGLKSYHDRSHLEDDDRIRHVQLEALPQDVCESKADDYPAGTLICALPEGGRGVFSGDSGGPLVRERDGALIGVAHGISNDAEKTMETGKLHVTLTKYMKIDYYFNWISNVTGISLPECGPISPPPNSEDVEFLELYELFKN